MCFRKRNKPVRLQKQKSIKEELEPFLNAELVFIIVFIIIFILSIIFAMGEMSYYNMNNIGGYVINGVM